MEEHVRHSTTCMPAECTICGICVCMCVLQAKRYLQKVRYYRESGFREKSIHEAYEKAGKDWERALDILTTTAGNRNNAVFQWLLQSLCLWIYCMQSANPFSVNL